MIKTAIANPKYGEIMPENTPKVKPILFNCEMVQALLSGRKTQTRRALNLQPNRIIRDDVFFFPDQSMMNGTKRTSLHVYCPFGKSGDLLYVRETCRADENEDSGVDYVEYLAGGKTKDILPTEEAVGQWLDLHHYRNKYGAVVPSIHMPRWASRLTLRILDVRVERVQDITHDNAEAEGIKKDTGKYRYAASNFAALWDSINDQCGFGWDANPWVWVVEFEVLHGNVDSFIIKPEKEL